MPIFDYSHQLFDHLIHFPLHNGHPPSPLFHLPPRFLMIIFPSILLQKRIPFRVAQPSLGVSEPGGRGGPFKLAENPTSTKGGQKICPSHYYPPPQILRPSDIFAVQCAQQSKVNPII